MNKRDITYADKYFNGWTAKDHEYEVKRLKDFKHRTSENEKIIIWHQKMADYKNSKTK